MGLCRRYILPDFEKTIQEFNTTPESLSIIEFGYQNINRDNGYDKKVIYPTTLFRDMFNGKFKSLRTIDICGGKDVEKIDLRIVTDEHDCADIVTDYGTAEHVGTTIEGQYNFWINAHKLLKKGGIAIHAVPVFGKWPGHCKWYYSESFFEEFKNCGYEIIMLETTWQDLVFCKLRKVREESFMTLKDFIKNMKLMRKILLDCGSHFGQSIDKLKKMLPVISEYEIYMFEPNPYLFKKLVNNSKYVNCKKYDVAVSNKEGREIFWGCTRNKDSYGSTLERSKADRDKIISTDYVEVQTIDLSDFIIKNFSNSDYIILKLDIEGSEYDVLEKLLESGAIAYINKLYCEFHSNRLAPEFKNREVRLIEKLTAAGITPEFWG